MHACMRRRHAESGLRWNDDMNKHDEQAHRRRAGGRAMNKINKYGQPQQDDDVDEGRGGIRDIPSAWRRASRYGTRPRKRPMAAGAKLRTRRARTHSEAWTSSSKNQSTRQPNGPLEGSTTRRAALQPGAQLRSEKHEFGPRQELRQGWRDGKCIHIKDRSGANTEGLQRAEKHTHTHTQHACNLVFTARYVHSNVHTSRSGVSTDDLTPRRGVQRRKCRGRRSSAC